MLFQSLSIPGFLFNRKIKKNGYSFNRSVPCTRPFTHAHLFSLWCLLCVVAPCMPSLLVPLNNVYAKQVRFLLTALQNRMFHRAQLHCLSWWLPAICSGVTARTELHKMWKIHFSSWDMDLSWIIKEGMYYVLLHWWMMHCSLLLKTHSRNVLGLKWREAWWFISQCMNRITLYK